MEKLQLEYFEMVAKTLNISKAAELLYISQSSLSQTIKRLEKEVGYPLFDRSGKHIRLNKNGTVFLSCVQRMKEIFDDSMVEMAENNHRLQREVTLFMGCASLFLPKLLVYLKKNTTDVSFHVTQWNYGAKDDSYADLQIIAVSRPLTGDNVSLLLEEDILLALPHGHPLMEKERILSSDLANEEFISLNPAWSLEESIMEIFSQKDFHPSVAIQVDNPTILRQLLCEGLGIAFIPDKTWGTSFAKGALELRPLADISMKRYIYLLWREGFLKQNVQECIPLIQKFFQTEF